MDNGKNKDEERNVKFLYSLAPTSSADNIDVYKDYIESALDETEDTVYSLDREENSIVDNGISNKKLKNKNIAIMSNYGGGKSSIVKTFFAKCDKYNYLNVSLGAYLELCKGNNNQNGNSKETIKEDIKDIESSILQQIIFTEKPDKILLSRLDRIDYSKESIQNKAVFYSVLIVVLIVLLTCLGNIECLQYIFNDDNYLSLYIPILCFIFIDLVGIIYLLITKTKIKKISVNLLSGDLNLERGNISSNSILNNNIEELINFFYSTDYSIVVFEDIDRLYNKGIVFNKLKEINHILNNAIKTKTIQFIYCVGDDVFGKSEERTKFFDIIIPIVPFAEYGNSETVFCDLMRKNKLLTKDGKLIDAARTAIKTVSYYIYNARCIYEIINEYKVYDSDQYDDFNKLQLFYLLSYKVLYPKRFSNLLENRGPIAYYFSSEFEQKIIDVKLREMRQSLSFINKLLSKIESNNISLLDALNELFSNNLDSILSGHNDCIVLSNGNYMCDTDDFVSEISINWKLLAEEIFEIRDNGNELVANEKRLFSCISKDLFMYIAENVNNDNPPKLLKDLIENVGKDIDNYDSTKMSLSDRISFLEGGKLPKHFCFTTKDDILINNYEREMLLGGHILHNYLRLVNYRHSNSYSLTKEEDNIIAKIKNGDVSVNTLCIKEPAKIFNNLSPNDFALDSVNNEYIFRELINSKEIDKYLTVYYNNLNTLKVVFLTSIQEKGINIFQYSGKFFNFIWTSRIKYYSSDVLNCLVLNTIMYCKISSLSDNALNLFYEIANNNESFIKYVEGMLRKNDGSYGLMLEKRLKNFNIKYNPNVSFTDSKKHYYNYIYEYNMFSKCSNHILFLAQKLKFKFDDSRIIESINNLLDGNNVKEVLLDDFDNTVNDYIFKIDKEQKDDEYILSYFCELHNVSTETFGLILSKESDLIRDLSCFNDQYKGVIISNKKVYPNWNNIRELFRLSENKISEYIAELINDNVKILKKDKSFNHALNKELCSQIIASEDISSETLEQIIDVIMDNYHYITVESFEPKKVSMLIDHKKYYPANLEQMNKLNNMSIDVDHKAKAIMYNIVDVKDYDFNNCSVDLIEAMLNYINSHNAQVLLSIAINHPNREIIKNKIMNGVYTFDYKLSSPELLFVLSANGELDCKKQIVLRNADVVNRDNIMQIVDNIFPKEKDKIRNKKNRVFIDNNVVNTAICELLIQNCVITGIKTAYVNSKLSLIM